MSTDLCRNVLRQHAKELLSKDGVVAVGVGEKMIRGHGSGKMSVVCSVKKKLIPELLNSKDYIPMQLDGVPTDVVEVGTIRALEQVDRMPLEQVDRMRPAPGGISIGHPSITAGTLGCLVSDASHVYILSNNHVLANSNSAQIGDDIYQPGPHDGGGPDDVIGSLAAFEPIVFVGDELPSDCKFATVVSWLLNLGCELISSRTRYRITRPQALTNFVDAALCLPFSIADVKDEILGLGAISGSAEAALGMKVKKSGRTTGVTHGEVVQTDVMTQVSYGAGKVAIFEDQVMIGPGGFSAGGDSGSAVLDDQNRLVGLLFAGSEQVTIVNRIEHVFDKLKVQR